MKRRYPFVQNNDYAVISCITSSQYRGMNIYPSQIQKVAASQIAEKYYIWAEKENYASIRGIQKAGAKKMTDLTQEKYLFGLYSKLNFENKESFIV